MSELRRNKPYVAFDKDSTKGYKIPKGSSFTATFPNNTGMGFTSNQEYYLIPKDECRTLYDGRYCAVVAFIFAVVNGKFCVLANRRGVGTPDFQGFWNCPCGFLERNEFGNEGAARETFEECSYKINPKKLKMVGVQTDPVKSNNGNVTIRFSAFVGSDYLFEKAELNRNGGEENEVDDIKWIPVDEIDMYDWAFGHEETIREVMPGKWKRKWLTFKHLFV
jgi:8-oxo-dGTP pyrophosphatase MutT (NUDIX family)